MSLVEVKHQTSAQRFINRALLADRIPHALVFHGPDGIGKELFACGLAQTLLCASPIDRPITDVEDSGTNAVRQGCGECEDCRTVSTGSHPDIHFIYRQLNRDHPDDQVRRRKALDIGVDVVREFLIKSVGLTPQRGRWKVFVIREADRITTQAQNALLKTLEEPPQRTTLILLATDVNKLLPTTKSRCQVIPFDPLPVDFVRSKLGEMLTDANSVALDWYARVSEGSLGKALQLAADDIHGVNERMLQGLSNVPRLDASAIVASWMEESKALAELQKKRDPEMSDTERTRVSLQIILSLASTWYADVLRVAQGGTPALTNETLRSTASKVAARCSADSMIWAIERIARAEQQLRQNANVSLVLETLVNALARPATQSV